MDYPNLLYEKNLKKQGFKIIAGTDEAGRGAWAGPIVAGSVILPFGLEIEGLKDSKLLNSQKRETLYQIIIEKAISWSVGIVPEDIIDKIGISEANQEAINKAVAGLEIKPDFLLMDYLPKKKVEIVFNLPHQLVKKGDRKIVSIAAASIIAKVTRDRIMKKYAQKYTDYGFDSHKGYGTAYHKKMLFQKGLCKIHRKSYRPMSLF